MVQGGPEGAGGPAASFWVSPSVTGTQRTGTGHRSGPRCSPDPRQLFQAGLPAASALPLAGLGRGRRGLLPGLSVCQRASAAGFGSVIL